MSKRCHFDNKKYCDIWVDYQVSLHSLQEADELARQNWQEIQYLHDRVCQLENYIKEIGLILPEELD